MATWVFLDGFESWYPSETVGNRCSQVFDAQRARSGSGFLSLEETSSASQTSAYGHAAVAGPPVDGRLNLASASSDWGIFRFRLFLRRFADASVKRTVVHCTPALRNSGSLQAVVIQGDGAIHLAFRHGTGGTLVEGAASSVVVPLNDQRWTKIEGFFRMQHPSAGNATVESEVTITDPDGASDTLTQSASELAQLTTPAAYDWFGIFNPTAPYNSAGTWKYHVDDFIVTGASGVDYPGSDLPVGDRITLCPITGQGSEAEFTGDWDAALYHEHGAYAESRMLGTSTQGARHTFTHESAARLGLSDGDQVYAISVQIINNASFSGTCRFGLIVGASNLEALRTTSTNATNERVLATSVATLSRTAFDALEVGVIAPTGLASLTFARFWGVIVQVLHDGAARPIWLEDGTGGFQMTHVDYVGDGAAIREVSCGFRPHLVILLGGVNGAPYIKAKDWPANVAMRNAGVQGNMILRLTDTGFTLGTANTPVSNVNATRYRAICIRDDGSSPAGRILISGAMNGNPGQACVFNYPTAVAADVLFCFMMQPATGASLGLLFSSMPAGTMVIPGANGSPSPTTGPTLSANGISSNGSHANLTNTSRWAMGFVGFRLQHADALDIVSFGAILSSLVSDGYPDLLSVDRQEGASSTSFNVALPATRRPGEIIEVIISKSLTDNVATPSGWTAIGTAGNTGAGGTARIHVFARILDGSEADTLALSAANTCVWHASVLRISGYEVATVGSNFASTQATGTSGDIDPPSVTQTSDTNLYQAVGVVHGNQTVTGFPTNYTLSPYGATILAAMGVGFAARQLTAGAENPGTFTNGSAPWRAHSIAVRGGNIRPISVTPFATRSPHTVIVRSDNVSQTGQLRWTDATYFPDQQSQIYGSASKTTGQITQIDLGDRTFTVASASGTGLVRSTSDAWWLAFSEAAYIEPAPIAVDDAYSTPFQMQLVVGAGSGVLANDNANGGGTMTAELVDDVGVGTLSLASDGSFMYDPPPGFSGVTTFTYRALNTTSESNVATVTITVFPSPGAEQPSVIVEMCFGGSYRSLVKGHPAILAHWYLSDVGSATAQDEIEPNDAMPYANSPVKARGLLPEYGLSTRFNGTDQSVVLDLDAFGIGEDSPFSVVALVRPTDVTAAAFRTIFSSTATGCRLGLTTAGAFSFGANGGTHVTGTQIVTAGVRYLVCATYDGTNVRLRVYAPDSATVLFDTAGPTAVSIGPHGGADAYIGRNNSEWWAGDLQGVALFSDDLSEDFMDTLSESTVWTNVSDDLRADVPLVCDRGFSEDRPDARTAKAGTATFALNNGQDNHGGGLGAYSPGHANLREGFGRGIPVRVTFSYAESYSALQFIGRLRNIKPTTDEEGARLTYCVAADWMDEAAKARMRGISLEENVTADEAMEILINSMNNKPHELNIMAGSDPLVTVFDNIKDEKATVQAEIVKLAKTEFGLAYVTGDGTFVFENRGARVSDGDPEYTVDNTMIDGDPDASTDQIINLTRVTGHPKKIDAAATTVLYETGDRPVALDNGASPEMFFGFRDPSQQATRVSGLDVVTPVPTTHYTINTAENGSGLDVTASPAIVLVWEIGSNGVYLTVNNGYGQRVYLTFEILGKGVYDYQPVTALRRSDESIEDIGEQPLDLDMPYQSSVPVLDATASYILNTYSSEVTRMKNISQKLRKNLTATAQCISGEISHRVAVTEDMSAVNGEFYIIGVRQEWAKDRDITTTWRLAPADTSVYWTFDVSQFDISTRFGF